MATKYYYLSGVTKWAKLRKPDEKYNNFQVPLYMDDKTFSEFERLGLGLKKREDDDGKYVIFKRPQEKIIKNELVVLGPPKIVDENNQPWDDRLIGNGSEVTVKIAVYDTRKGPGHTLESLRVEKLVEYNPPEMLGGGNVATGGPALPF